MEKIKRLYNQNRKKIWWGLIIIASFFIALQLLNNYVINNSQENIASVNNVTNTNTNSTNETTSKATTNTSGVGGGTVSEEALTSTQDILDTFFGYCNDNDLENAYNMLTDECKELIYPTLDSFTNNYYNNIFEGTQKIYSFENWNGNTYLVTIEEDILLTGQATNTEDKKVDYVTIVDDKLNISTFIGREEIDETTTDNGITFVVNSKDVYMDYETYNLTVTNNTGKTICLDDAENSTNIYLLDGNDIKYGVYNHELVQSSLVLKNNFTKDLSFKFYSSYVSTKKIYNIVFSNVYMDYDENIDDTDAIYVAV